MSQNFYLVLHVIGGFCLFFSIGGLFFKYSATPALPQRWPIMLHGVGLFLIFLAGFGLAARLGFTSSWPLWMLAKVGLWAIMGVLPFLLKKFLTPHTTPFWILLISAVGLGATVLGVFKGSFI